MGVDMKETADGNGSPITTEKDTGVMTTEPTTSASKPDPLYRRTPNRLRNTRWPIGEEPYHDAEGTHPDDPTVNIKLEVTEHPDTGPNQRHLLGGGAELRINCFLCKQPMHVAASKKAKEVLEEGGFSFTRDLPGLEQELVIVVCPQGHTMQFHEEHVKRMIKHV